MIKDFYERAISLQIFDKRRWPAALKEYLNAEDEFLLRKVKPNNELLDIGCGRGRHIRLLAKRCKNLAGIDFSSIILKSAGKNVSSIRNVKLILANAKKLSSEKC